MDKTLLHTTMLSAVNLTSLGIKMPDSWNCSANWVGIADCHTENALDSVSPKGKSEIASDRRALGIRP
jgi:hypothetical protein